MQKNPPFSQRPVLLLIWVLGGVVGAATVIDAFVGAIVIVTPLVTYLGTAALLALAGGTVVVLRWRPVRWTAADGTALNVIMPWRELAVVGGIILFLWIPRVRDLVLVSPRPIHVPTPAKTPATIVNRDPDPSTLRTTAPPTATIPPSAIAELPKVRVERKTAVKRLRRGLSSAEGSSEPDTLVFPAVIDRLYEGEFGAIPDTIVFRSYIVSVFRGLNDACGAPLRHQTVAAAEYGFPEVRRAQQSPQLLVMDILGIVAKYAENGSVVELEDGVAAMSPSLLPQGIEDGGALASHYECASWEIRRLRARLAELFEQRRSIEPQGDDAEQVLALMHPRYREIGGSAGAGMVMRPVSRAELEQACRRDTEVMLKSDKLAWCSCIAGALLSTDVSLTHRAALAKSFSHETLRTVEQASPRFAGRREFCRQ